MAGIQHFLEIPDGIITGPAEEALLALLRTTELVHRHANATLFTGPLSMAQFNLLMILEHDSDHGVSQTAIGRRLVTGSSNTSLHIKRLEGMGLIERRDDPADRRRDLITLTPEGRDALAEILPRYREAVDLIFGELPPRQLAAFLTILERLRQRIADNDGAAA